MAALTASAWTLAWRGGSIDAADWLPYAVGAALLLATVLLSGAAVPPGRAVVAAVAAFASLAAWDAISLTWSPSPALARDEALLTLFYAIAFLAVAATLRTAAGRLGATVVVTAGAAVLAIASAVELVVATDATDLFGAGRLAEPIGYPNAQAAAFLIGFWPAIALTARRSFPVLWRALALGGSVALGAGWLLAQSKGGAIAIAVSGVVFFALERGRLRALVPFLVSAAFVAGAFRPLTAPFRARGGSGFQPAIHTAGLTVLWLAGAATVVGFVYALADRRLLVGRRARRTAGAFVLLGVAAALAGSLAVFFLRVDRPRAYLDARWQSFKTLPKAETGSTHLSSLGSNRYDFWRVDIEEFRRHPIEGIGSRGWADAYLREGRSNETPARSHSVELDALGETGLVGLALLAVALLVPIATIGRRALRGLAPPGVLGGAVYWLVHASVDWLWTIPAVTLPFILLLGIGASGDGSREPAAAARPLRARLAVPLGLVAAAAAVFALAPPWLAARFTARAEAGSASPQTDLRWAKRLDPLSVEPFLAESFLARSPAAAIPPLRQAVAKEPRSAALRYLLGTAYLRARDPRAARRALLRAKRLSPRDPLIADALDKARNARVGG